MAQVSRRDSRSRPADRRRPARGPRLAWLRVFGPGLVTGASDNDPSGIGTFTQVGSQFGYGALSLPLLTYPMVAAVQELCARIGLETGRGLARSLRLKYPAWLVGACVLALAVTNTITLGADLGAIAAALGMLAGNRVPALPVVVLAAMVIFVLQAAFSYARIASVFKWLTLALFAYVAAGLLARPDLRTTLVSTFVPGVSFSADYLAAVVAVLGTTIAPYLFFWQATSEVGELREQHRLMQAFHSGVSRAGLRRMRVDVLLGMLFSQVVPYFIILAAAAGLHAHGRTDVSSAQQAAQALAPVAGPFASTIFALGVIGTGFLAVPILSGSAAYAVKEFFNLRGDFDLHPRVAPFFYGVIAAATAVGVAMNLVRVDTIHALYYASIASGLAAPLLLILILLLGADRKLMKKATSRSLSLFLVGLTTLVMTVAAAALLVLAVGSKI